MGGWGSGTWRRRDSKPTIGQYLALDVNMLRRKGALEPDVRATWQWTYLDGDTASINLRAIPNAVVLSYRRPTPDDESEQLSYSVSIDWSACNLGGERPWFRCPAKVCGRRVAKLYGGRYFLCRHCHGLVYASQREDASERMVAKGRKIGTRLGRHGDPWDCIEAKPKGMHWRTFYRLVDEMDEAERESDVLIFQRFTRRAPYRR